MRDISKKNFMKSYQFKTIINRYGKRSIILFNGTYYKKLDLDFLIQLRNEISNTIKDIDNINVYLEKQNKSIFETCRICYNNKEKINKKDKKGFVYLMKCNETGYYKIGKTNNVSNRFKQLKTANPTLELVNYLKVINNDIIENELHSYYKHKNIRGEWFNLTNIDVSEIVFLFKNFNNN